MLMLRVKQVVVFHLAIAASVLIGLVPEFQSSPPAPDQHSAKAYEWLLNQSQKLRAPSWEGPYFTIKRSTRLPDAPSLLLLAFGPESAESFQSTPPAPVDYAVVLHELENYGVRRIALADPLFWENPGDSDSSLSRLGLRSLLNEMQPFETILLGTPVDRTPRIQALTSVMESAAIPPANFSGDPSALPAANRIAFDFPAELPKGARLTPTHLSGQPDFLPSNDGRVKIPLLLRWGDKVIPTFTLGLVCDLLGAPIGSLKITLGSHIGFPEGNQIAIDEFGYAAVDLLHNHDALSLEADALLLEDGVDRSPNQKIFDQVSLVLVGQTDADPPPLETHEAQPHAQRPAFLAHAANQLAAHSAVATRTLLQPAKKWVNWVLLLNTAILGAVFFGRPARAAISFPLLAVGLAGVLGWLALRQGVWLSLPPLAACILTPLVCIPLLAWWGRPSKPESVEAESADSGQAEAPKLEEIKPGD